MVTIFPLARMLFPVFVSFRALAGSMLAITKYFPAATVEAMVADRRRMPFLPGLIGVLQELVVRFVACRPYRFLFPVGLHL